MLKDKSVLIREYLKKVKASKKELTKKEAFKDLLNRLYTVQVDYLVQGMYLKKYWIFSFRSLIKKIKYI